MTNKQIKNLGEYWVYWVDEKTPYIHEDKVLQLLSQEREKARREGRIDELEKAYVEIKERDPEFDRDWFKARLKQLKEKKSE